MALLGACPPTATRLRFLPAGFPAVHRCGNILFVRLAPAAKRLHGLHQTRPEGRQRVVDAQRYLPIVGSPDDAVGLKLLQLLDQHFVAHAPDASFKLAVTRRALV